ncbi:MAG TPA: sulfatase [Verrucomicrobiae bacterium]|nr:sulfatase [Verrucomicrobiae bacterium]
MAMSWAGGRILRGAVIFALALAVGSSPAADTSKLNILLIDIEDCNAGALGCYGNPLCKTPNLDDFCQTAVRFDRAHVQAVCCNPSRTSFLTGLRPKTTRVRSNRDVMSEHLPEGTLTLPEMLKAAGFYLADIGKLFHKIDYAERQMRVFDRIEMYDRPTGWKGPEPIIVFPPSGRKAVPDPAPPDHDSKDYAEWRRRRSDRYGDSGLKPDEERDYRMAVSAAALLKEFSKGDRRFFLAVAQSRPHTPLIAPKSFIDMYDPAQIPAPPAPPDSLVNFPYMQRARGKNPDIFTMQQPTPQQAREAIAAYYACLSFVDHNVGVILRGLEESGLADKTIVVFLGDHGFHLGDHGFWSKYSMLAATHRAPLIVRVPGAAAAGKTCDGIVEFVDLVPTLGELCGFQVPANLEGTSFAPLFSDPNRPWKTASFLVEGDSENGEIVRTRKYSYMEFEKGEMPAAMFDLEKDPWETRNIVDDPGYAAARKGMADLLHAGWKAALPPSAPARE